MVEISKVRAALSESLLKLHKRIENRRKYLRAKLDTFSHQRIICICSVQRKTESENTASAIKYIEIRKAGIFFEIYSGAIKMCVELAGVEKENV